MATQGPPPEHVRPRAPFTGTRRARRPRADLAGAVRRARRRHPAGAGRAGGGARALRLDVHPRARCQARHRHPPAGGRPGRRAGVRPRSWRPPASRCTSASPSGTSTGSSGVTSRASTCTCSRSARRRRNGCCSSATACARTRTSATVTRPRSGSWRPGSGTRCRTTRRQVGRRGGHHRAREAGRLTSCPTGRGLTPH